MGAERADRSPLSGLTVLVTRPAGQASRLTAALEAEGASVIELPAIAIEPPHSWEAVDRAIQRDAYAWVVFTSANAVDFFVSRLRALGHGPGWFSPTRVAVIGPATAARLRAAGVAPALAPAEYVAEALVAALVEAGPLTGQRVLLPRADIARDVLAAGLEAAGATVDRVAVYRTTSPRPDPAGLERLRGGGVDVVTFTSSSTVRNLVAMLGPDAGLLRRALIACIGPITAATAREAGLQPSVIAKTYTMAGLVDALRAHYRDRRQTKE